MDFFESTELPLVRFGFCGIRGACFVGGDAESNLVNSMHVEDDSVV